MTDRATIVRYGSVAPTVRKIAGDQGIPLEEGLRAQLLEIADHMDAEDEATVLCTIYAGALVAQVPMARGRAQQLAAGLTRSDDPTGVLVINDPTTSPPRHLHIRKSRIDAVEIFDPTRE